LFVGWIGLKYTERQKRLINLFQPHLSIYVSMKMEVISRSLDLYALQDKCETNLLRQLLCDVDVNITQSE
jgi:hypothetical protein